jgi:hypothetical protein
MDHILDILRKDNPSVEGLDGGDCFQAEETGKVTYVGFAS